MEQRLKQLLDQLISEGEAVLGTQWQPQGRWVTTPPTYVDLAAFKTWRAKCKHLFSMLGHFGRPWQDDLTANWTNLSVFAISTQSTLQAIASLERDGLLIQLEDLVFADAFANLLEQSEHLQTQGYSLAAGVILRAVLEERLRRLCDQHGLVIKKAKSTLADYNTALYKGSIYDKIMFKEIEALIAIGNAAAHNEPSLKTDSVARLHDGVVRVLQRFSS